MNAALHRSFAAAEAVLLASLREVTLARLSAEFRKRHARDGTPPTEFRRVAGTLEPA